MNKCSKCNNKFKTGAMKVGCDFCVKWFHGIDCAEIKTELWDMLNKEKQLHWYCKECNKIAPEVLILVQKCMKENIEMKKDIAEMKEELKEERNDSKGSSPRNN